MGPRKHDIQTNCSFEKNLVINKSELGEKSVQKSSSKMYLMCYLHYLSEIIFIFTFFSCPSCSPTNHASHCSFFGSVTSSLPFFLTPPTHLFLNSAPFHFLSICTTLCSPFFLHFRSHLPSLFPPTAASPQAVPEWLTVPRVPLEVPAAHLAHVWLLWHTRLVLPLPHHSNGF